MSGENILRLNYYDKQYLRTRDFQDEQAYHIEMRHRHLVAHHTAGIVTGLEITQDPTSKLFSLQPGIAVDGLGREIVVGAAELIDSTEVQRQLGGASGDLKIWIAYRLELAVQAPAGYQACDAAGQFIRTRETFRLIYQDDPPTLEGTAAAPKAYEDLPDDPQTSPWPVYLARVTLTAGVISAVAPAGRRYVGLTVADISAVAPAQPFPAATPALPAALSLRADEINLTGLTATAGTQVKVNGNLELDGGKLDLRGALGAGSASPLTIARGGAADLRLQIGNTAADGARLIIGPGVENKVIITADGTVSIDGKLNVQNSAELSVQGGRLAFKNQDGSETPDVTEITRLLNPVTNTLDLQIAIGTAGSSTPSRLVVGPKSGTALDGKLVVGSNGDVTVGGQLTANGFTLFHRGADLVISGRTGGNPRALVDMNRKLIINFAGDYSLGAEVQSRLNVTGNIDTTGLVDGRDLAADGAKLDGIGANANHTQVLSGILSNGDTVPLPVGFTQAQCRWIVSPRSFDTGNFDINEGGAAARFLLACQTNASRVVDMRWVQLEQDGALHTYGGTVNYLVIGVQ